MPRAVIDERLQRKRIEQSVAAARVEAAYATKAVAEAVPAGLDTTLADLEVRVTALETP